MEKTDFFRARTILIATKHGKEKLIGPVFQEALETSIWTPPDYDTDVFGTFSGEKERQHDPLTTARKKCLAALEKYNLDLGIASEGSFGPHPQMPFLPCNEEFLILVDKKNNLEFSIRELSTETNFAGTSLENIDELQSFAESVFFPGHALILKDRKDEFREVRKGISDWYDLYTAFDYFFHKYGQVFAETDMRAHLNPTRMKVIRKAAEKLARKMTTLCPFCGFPGFSVRGITPGLPCRVCLEPTQSTLSQTCSCQSCGYSEEKMYPNDKTFEDPQYCNFCNP